MRFRRACPIKRSDFSKEDQKKLKWFQETILDHISRDVGRIRIFDALFGGNLTVSYKYVDDDGHEGYAEYHLLDLFRGNVVPMWVLLDPKHDYVHKKEAARQALRMGMYGPNSQSPWRNLQRGDAPEVIKNIEAYWGMVDAEEQTLQRELDIHGLQQLGYEVKTGIDPLNTPYVPVPRLYPTQELLERMEPLVTAPRPKKTKKPFAVKRAASLDTPLAPNARRARYGDDRPLDAESETEEVM